jgi:hypothetical protein
MTDGTTQATLSRLEAQVAALTSQLASTRASRDNAPRRLRRRMRFLPALVLALFAALVPLSLLAANPFTDLVPGSVHNADIEAIYNAGITKGCVPDQQYCPTDVVTREQMATFLARLGGLGGNPAVANAKTAQTATSAQTAISAVSAQTAQDAGKLGGLPPSAFLSSAGDMTFRYSFHSVTAQNAASGFTFDRTTGPTVVATSNAAKIHYAFLSLDRPTSMFGVNLAVKSLEICYGTSGGYIAGTAVYSGLTGEGTERYYDTLTRNATDGCYTVSLSQQVIGEPIYLVLKLNYTAAPYHVRLHSAKLTLTPTKSGTP